MGALTWDNSGERFYETGIRKGVLFVQNSDGTYANGVAWSGLTGITESPSGAEPTAIYADDIKYLNLYSAEDFGGTIEALTYPDEFAQCNGAASIANGVMIGQQARKSFGLCYRTAIGNDIDGDAHGYKLHFIYNAKVSPSEMSYSTINDSPETAEMSWEFSTTAVNITGYQPSATIVVDSRKFTSTNAKAALAALEAYVYGTDGTPGTDSQMPSPAKIIELLTYL